MEEFQTKKYSCKICLKPIDRKKFLRRHLIIRHQLEFFRSDGTQIRYRKPIKKTKYEEGQEIFKCEICPATFNSKSRLWDHRPRHREENYIICEVEGCGHRMYKRDRHHHYRQIHTFSTQLCEICSRTFRNYDCLRRHKYKVHDSIRCKGCGSCYLKKEQDKHQCPKTLDPRPEYVRNHHCEICGRSYTSGHLLKRHMREKHNFDGSAFKADQGEMDSLTCDNCSEEFDSRELLNRHKKICRCLLCPTCSCPFKDQEKLDQHIARHAEEKSNRNFKCPHCTCRFNTDRILQTHIVKRHTNEELGVGMNFECHLCDLMFRKSKLLKIHFETRHNLFMEDLDNVCAICIQPFSDLPRHMKTVHKKTFVCEFNGCPKKFRTEESLKFHKRSHEPDFVPDLSCSVCLNVYPNQKSLVEHFKKHGDYKPPSDNPRKGGKKKTLKVYGDFD